MYRMMQQRVISTNTLKRLLLQNNQNREQNKLVNMANGNDLIEHNNEHIYILSPDMYILETEWYLDR